MTLSPAQRSRKRPSKMDGRSAFGQTVNKHSNLTHRRNRLPREFGVRRVSPRIAVTRFTASRSNARAMRVFQQPARVVQVAPHSKTDF